jgi:uncharacterized protein (TIRG00374 family)
MNKKQILLIVKILLSGIAVTVVVSRIDLRSVASVFSTASPFFLGVGLLLAFLQHALNAVKIKVLLPDCPISLFYIILTNFAANFFRLTVPTEIGAELGRAYYLNKKTGSPAASFSAIIIDRYTGLFAQVTVMAAASLIAAAAGGGRFWARLGVAGAIGAALLIAFPLLFFRFPGIKQSSRRGFRRITGALSRLSVSIAAFRAMPLRLATAAVIALVYQCLILTMLIAVSRAFHVPLGFPQAALISLFSTIGFLIPSLAGLGIVEGVFAGMFGYFGSNKEIGLAVSLSLRMITLVIVVPGIIFFIGGDKIVSKAALGDAKKKI